MKKTLLMLVAIAGFVAHADYLYWMVDTSSDLTDSLDWSTAKLFVGDSTTPAGTVSREVMASINEDGGYAYSNIGSAYTDATSFYIELYNGSSPEQQIARANIGTGSSLAAYIFGNNSMAAQGTMGGFAAGPSTFNVPEPTSGLLFLVGGMLLGLRRKRRV